MSAIQAISAAYYTTLANNAMYSVFSANSARMGLMSNAGNISFGSLESLNAIDTNLELSILTNSLQYKMAKAMLEQIKKQQKEDAQKFNLFA